MRWNAALCCCAAARVGLLARSLLMVRLVVVRLWCVCLAVNFTLDWNLGQSDITLRLRAATSGWLGVGFSETGHMLGADIVTVSVAGGASSTVTVTDRNCPWSAMPLLSAPSIYPAADTPACAQNWQVVCGFGSSDYTEVWISRARETGDPQDRVIGAGQTTLIYAWGGSGASNVAFHGSNRGSVSVDFGGNGSGGGKAASSFVPPSDTATFVDLNFSAYLTHGVATQYVCQGVDIGGLVSLGENRHVTAVDVVLPAGGAFLPLVHHVLVHDSGSAPAMFYTNEPYPCQSSALSDAMGDSVLGTPGTYGLMYGWALGGSPLTFPVGLLGGWLAGWHWLAGLKRDVRLIHRLIDCLIVGFHFDLCAISGDIRYLIGVVAMVFGGGGGGGVWFRRRPASVSAALRAVRGM